MREIKFRGWNKETKQMFAVMNIDFISSGTSGCTTLSNWYAMDCDQDGFFDESGSIVLMQYTGLKDKNGKEIYEGDILLFNNSHNDRNNKWKCVVKYREGSFVCEYPVDGVYNHFDSWNVPKVTWEVIGNIYEHPHLLGGKK